MMANQPKTFFDTLNQAMQEMLRRLDEVRPCLLRLLLRPHGSQYAVEYHAEPLRLPFDSDPDPGAVIAGPQGIGPTGGEQASDSMDADGRSGSGPIIPPGNAGGNNDETGGDESTTLAPPEIGDDPIDILVIVHEQNFRQDVISAVLQSDPGPYLRRQISIETHDLPRKEWSALMETAREKQPVFLTVRLIVSGEHRIHRSRVVASQVIGAAQQSLF